MPHGAVVTPTCQAGEEVGDEALEGVGLVAHVGVLEEGLGSLEAQKSGERVQRSPAACVSHERQGGQEESWAPCLGVQRAHGQLVLEVEVDQDLEDHDLEGQVGPLVGHSYVALVDLGAQGGQVVLEASYIQEGHHPSCDPSDAHHSSYL